MAAGCEYTVEMNIRKPILLMLMMSLSWTPAIAQKMYKWVDEDGNVHYSDSVPPADVDEARDEFNQHGRVIDHVDRALTPEELKLKSEADEATRLEQERKDQQLAEDRKLLTIYAAEVDITRTRDQQVGVIERSIEAGEAILSGQTRSLANLMERAAQMEGQGNPVSPALETSIKEIRRQINMQKGYVSRLEQEKLNTIKHYDQELIRYRDVKKRWGLEHDS